MTPDTIIDGENSTQGWNRFSYCHGNPIIYKDPSGHFAEDEGSAPIQGSGYNDNQGNVHLINAVTGTVDKATDTLWSIAKDRLSKEKDSKQKVTNSEIKQRVDWIKDVNGLKNDIIKKGQKLVTGLVDKNIGKEGLEEPILDPLAAIGLAKGFTQLATKGGKALIGNVALKTEYGWALQSFSKEALQMRQAIKKGASLFKGGKLGSSNTIESQFWSAENPLGTSFAKRYGVPEKNLPFNFVMEGSLKEGGNIITRKAPGVGSNLGGAIEAVVEKGSVKVNKFTMP